MSERPRRSDYAIALFVTVVWAAIVFAVDGILAVTLDRDPIEAQVSPYYAIIALLLASVVTWLAVAAALRSATPWLSAITSTALVYLVLVASAIPVGLGLVAEQASSPFVIAAALLSGAVVVAAWAAFRTSVPNRPTTRER
jgi:hypothetical protein